MKLTGDQRTQFEEAVKSLMKFLNENCHPHTTVIVDCTNAELMEGAASFRSEEYTVDPILSDAEGSVCHACDGTGIVPSAY